jgi:multiple sugar transport system ATP-binding protein
MRAEIAALQRELGVTTFYVTHDQVEAMTMGDRVAVIKDGFLQQVDTPQNLYDRPTNVFVGAFIGSPSMNLYAGTVNFDGDTATVTLGSSTLRLDPAVLEKRPALKNYAGQEVIVGIRPEDFEDAELVEHASDDQIVTSTVQLIEALGSEIMVHFDIDSRVIDSGDPDAVEDTEAVTNAVGRFHPRSRVRMGEPMRAVVTTENIHFFDMSSREAIWD